MRKLDRLVWADGIAVNAYGLRIGIRVSEAWALEPLVKILPVGATPAKRPHVDYLYSVVVAGGEKSTRRRFNLIYGDAFRIGKSESFADVVEAMEQELTLFVGEASKNRVFVHAGVVGWRGRAIVLPGATMSGKSTLVEALVRAGARYYSDEYAVIDHHSRVHPFARPLSLRRQGEHRGQPVPIAEIGGREGRTPLPIGLVFFTSYETEATAEALKLTPGEALLGLLENTFSARSQTERALSVLGAITEHTPCLRGPRGEAAKAAEWLLERVS